MRKVKQLRNRLRRHLSVGSLVVVTGHNLPDLKRPHNKLARLCFIQLGKKQQEKHLTCCIKKAKGVWFTPDHYSYCIVVKNLWQKIWRHAHIKMFCPCFERMTTRINLTANKKNTKILTVGTYSDGNLLVVYEINKQVFPTAPSPTTTHLIVCISVLSDSAVNTANCWEGGGDITFRSLTTC